jgi:type II secretory pathway pseudopilin PulG
MSRFADRVKAIRGQRGFSIVEVLVSGVVLVVGLVMLSQFFASSAARVLESDVRSVLNQVAAQEIDRIRGLEYSEVGTVHGWPSGGLVDDETRVVDINQVRIQREVIFWTDESDARGASAPASYRRVTVKVSAVDHPALDPVEVVSNIAGGSTGGNIHRSPSRRRR